MDPHDATHRDDAPHPHDAAAIANELYRYAELIDAGRFTELGELMEHCTFSYGDPRRSGTVGRGRHRGELPGHGGHLR